VAELSGERYIELILLNSGFLRGAAADNMAAPISACPGWTTGALVAHLGEVQRFWALQIRSRASEAIKLPDEELKSCEGLLTYLDEAVDKCKQDASIPPGLLAWADAGTKQLVKSFEGIGGVESVWHWSGDNRPITHMRNQALEATVHRWDVENAVGVASRIDDDIAIDGINQHFEVQVPAARKFKPAEPGTGESFHFHATDGDGEWFVVFDGDTCTFTQEHAHADLAVRGSTEELFLWLWNRVPDSEVNAIGDVSLLSRYRKLAPGL
jgi:uncharacterized protein (TIGR03083 family)